MDEACADTSGSKQTFVQLPKRNFAPERAVNN